MIKQFQKIQFVYSTKYSILKWSYNSNADEKLYDNDSVLVKPQVLSNVAMGLIYNECNNPFCSTTLLSYHCYLKISHQKDKPERTILCRLSTTSYVDVDTPPVEGHLCFQSTHF